MHLRKLAKERSDGLYYRDSCPMHEGCSKSEKRAFDFRKMFATIALYIGGRTVRRGYFCDVVMDENVPRYLRGYPDILKELICSLAEHSLAEMKNGGMVVKVESATVQNGKGHLVTVDISDTGRGSCEQCSVLENILDCYCEAAPYLSWDRSSWIYSARQLKEPLRGRVVVRSLYGWGNRYRIEVEVESRESRAAFLTPAGG